MDEGYPPKIPGPGTATSLVIVKTLMRSVLWGTKASSAPFPPRKRPAPPESGSSFLHR